MGILIGGSSLPDQILHGAKLILICDLVEKLWSGGCLSGKRQILIGRSSLPDQILHGAKLIWISDLAKEFWSGGSSALRNFACRIWTSPSQHFPQGHAGKETLQNLPVDTLLLIE